MNDECFGSDKHRYETTAIAQGLPFEYRMILWALIDGMKNEVESVDYLQVFELSYKEENGSHIQIIRHSQECPPYCKEYHIPAEGAGINDKVYAIDDGKVCAMLWAREY